MEAPPWIEELGQAYVAGEASLFVVQVADRAAAEALLVARLSTTRAIVGVVGADGLRFPNLGDLARFDQLWEARRVLAGAGPRPSPLARVWAVLEVADVSQGWILRDGEALAGTRTALDAPALAAWTAAPRLREANHVVVVLATSLRALDPALLAAARVLDGARPSPPPPAPAPGPTAPADLEARITTAFADYLPGWPAAAWPSRAPFLAAITELLAGEGVIAPVTVRWDGDVGLALDGPGAEDFRARWGADLALDGALGTLSRDWEIPEGGFAPGGVPAPDPTGMRVLVRRLGRAFFTQPADG
jgi:hypothetical protein